MTERGYFFDGITTGDSSVAPYDDSEFVEPFRLYGDYVIPQYENELNVYSADPTNGKVNVDTGSAMVYGTLYENTAVVAVAITAAVNNRIDRIVLRFTAGVTQTVRVTKIIGVEAANPNPPALGATDFPLAWIWIPAGYDPTTTVIDEIHIHDERLFKQIGLLDNNYSLENIMPNSEFFAYSGGAAGNQAPDYWGIYGGVPTTIGNANLTNFPNQIRGQSVRIQCGAVVNRGIATFIPVVGAYNDITADNNILTIKGQIYITSGEVGITVCNADNIGGTYTVVEKRFLRTGVTQEFLIRVPLDPTTFRPFLYIRIENITAPADFYVGQIIVVRGYVPGNFREKHEVLFFGKDVNDAAWNSSAKSTSTTTINIAGSFGSVIPPYFRGLIYRVRARDSGSAAGNVMVTMYHTDANSGYPSIYLNLSGLTNDVWRELVGVVANKVYDANAPIKVYVLASGAGTCDVTIQPIGIIT